MSTANRAALKALPNADAGFDAAVDSLFAAPQAVVQVSAVAMLVKVAVFGGAASALLAVGRPGLAVALAAGALLSSVLSTSPGTPSAPEAGSVVSGPASG